VLTLVLASSAGHLTRRLVPAASTHGVSMATRDEQRDGTSGGVTACKLAVDSTADMETPVLLSLCCCCCCCFAICSFRLVFLFLKTHTDVDSEVVV